MEKTKFLVLALRSYNKYLMKSLNLQLDELQISPRLFRKQSTDEKELYLYFQNNDTLQPLEYFTQDLDNKELFLQTTTGERIREWGDFVTAIIPIMFTILAIVLPQQFGASGNSK